MSLTSILLPITHTSRLTQWGPGSFSCLVGQPQGSMPSPKLSTSCPTGNLTPRSYATGSGRKNDNWSKQKSASSPDTWQPSKSASTTAGVTWKQKKFPSCCKTSEGMPNYPRAAEANTCVRANAFASMAQKLHSEGEVMLPPRQAAKLPLLGDCCKCGLEWHCEPHSTCFIHDSCFSKGSDSFPPVKPPCSSWSQSSYDWYVELASCLNKCYALTTKTPISHFHDLSLDLFLSGLVWLQICYAEVQSSIIDGYLAFLKVRYLF